MTNIETRWARMWEERLAEELEDERSAGYLPFQYYRSGRASKEFPDKEGPDWWEQKGPGFVKSWVAWRDACGLDIWETPDGEPGIELEVRAKLGDLEVLCYIDRITFVEGTDPKNRLYIVDLKSGSSIDAWPRQLALNNLGLLDTFGVWATYGGYWKARSGGIEPDWFDLRIYTPEWLWEQVRVTKAIRDQQLFAAQPNNLCNSACGVRDYCRAVAGPLSLTLRCNPDTQPQE